MIIPPRRLFTWIDIDDQLAEVARREGWPEWLIEASAYWDSLELVTSRQVEEALLADWLGEKLGPGTVDQIGARFVVRLEASSDGDDRELTIVQRVLPDLSISRSPLWRQGSAHRAVASALPRPEAELPVPLFAFHSYKGGVGRTTHALAAALNLTDQGARVLVIDGDVEAPGLSWMFRDDGREADYAYEDFLALVQSSPSGNFTEAIALARRFVPNQAIDGLLFMPSSRDLLSLTPPRVAPADLIVPGRSPYHLTNGIGELAASLGVDAVVLDLRAGASEFSSQILLDPRVNRVFVTSASAQSLEGTETILGAVTRLAPVVGDDLPYPAVVLTQYRDSMSAESLSRMVAPIVGLLTNVRDAGDAEEESTAGELDSISLGEAVAPVYSRFHESLLQLPKAWSDVVAVVREIKLPALMDPIVGLPRLDHQLRQVDGESPDGTVPTVVDRRRMLGEFAAPLAFAESTATQDFLVTDALQDLVVSHRTLLPVAVVSGAKGAGKTFTQLQMIYRRTWQEYAGATQVGNVSVDARIVPVLTSRNLHQMAETRVGELRDEAAGRAVDFAQLELSDEIDRALGRETSDREWRQLWVWGLARSVGLDVPIAEAEAALVDEAKLGSRWVFVMDGLEDRLQNIATDVQQQRALRVLLTDCLDWVRSIRTQPYGLVVFVRRDLVRAALPQNSAQFLSRYSKYELLWNEDEAVRLAAWVVTKSGALEGTESADVRSLSSDRLTEVMLPVWGEKMGTPKSREARSRSWFIAALSDFKGGIQARDIVLFLAEAAKGSISDERWVERLLIPAAMRNALLECSKQKIQAIGEETPRIKDIFNHLRALDVERRQVPFVRETVELESADIDLLEQNGVVFREENQYWIPEIFRHGLDFRANGRPRIVSVANLVRKRNNTD